MEQPWSQKINTLQERVLNLSGECPSVNAGHEEHLRVIEQKIAREDETSKAKLQNSKANIARLQYSCSEECFRVSQLATALQDQLRGVEGQLVNEISRERQSCKDNEQAILALHADSIMKLKVEQARILKDRAIQHDAQQKAIRQELERAEEMLQEESESMEGQYERLVRSIAHEIGRLEDAFSQEQSRRADSQDQLYQKLSAMNDIFQKQLMNERKEREAAEELMLRLVEKTCQKVEQNIRRKLS